MDFRSDLQTAHKELRYEEINWNATGGGRERIPSQIGYFLIAKPRLI